MESETLLQAFSRIEREHGNRPAFRFVERMAPRESAVIWSYAEFVEKLRRGAALLRALGVGKADTVGLLIANTPDAQMALYAAELAGCALPMNLLLTDEHLVSLLSASNARVLIATELDDRIQRIAAQVPSLRHVLALAGASNTFAARAAAFIGATDLEGSPEAGRVVATFHTGGTTGRPKLARHHQSNQLAAARATVKRAGIGADDVIVNALPLFHVAGPICIGLSAMMAGACQMLCTPLGPRHPEFNTGFWGLAARHGVTIIGGVPTTIGALLKTLPERRSDQIRLVITGGAPLPASLEHAIVTTLGAELCVIYGMTETAGLISLRPPGRHTPAGWLGPAAPGNAIRIVKNPDVGGGSPVACGNWGHVLVTGPTVGPGYTDAAANAKLFTADGWLRTGDLGLVDKDGNLKLTGRAKDLIIRSGHNIDPSLIEAAAEAFPGVSAAAAVGAPDAYAGELPVLFVQVDPGATIHPRALMRWIGERVERPAVPKWVERVDVLPLTPVGKIYKPALVAKAVIRTLETLLSNHGLGDALVSVMEHEGRLTVEVEADTHACPAVKTLTDALVLDVTVTPKS